MAKPTPKSNNQPTTGFALPQPITDPRNELFYLLGYLRGRDADTAVRIAELVIELLPQPQPEVE
jgi:hypothetical protein